MLAARSRSLKDHTCVRRSYMWIYFLLILCVYVNVFFPCNIMRCNFTAEVKLSCVSHRYTAVAMPMLYNTRYSSRRRVTVMISVVWVLSFAISCPLLFGLNNTGKKKKEAAASHLFSFVQREFILNCQPMCQPLLAHFCINIAWKEAPSVLSHSNVPFSCNYHCCQAYVVIIFP